MARKQIDNIIIENARIRFRNFAGAEGKYNPAGRKNFCVLLDTDLAHELEKDGWKVRWLEPRDDQEELQAYMQVAVSFENIPPKVVMITSRGKTILDDESVNVLDWADIATLDLIIRPYQWTMNAGTRNESSGVKAYLKSLYATIAEDAFERKYYDAPEDDVLPPGECVCGSCGRCDRRGECRNDSVHF